MSRIPSIENVARRISLARGTPVPLPEQICRDIGAAIRDGRLAPGARLPSWRDLAAQLGVARSTVRTAYDMLVDSQLIISSGPAGTHVADDFVQPRSICEVKEEAPLNDLFHEFSTAPAIFQMGVPSQDAFPFKLWSRILGRATREIAAGPVNYADPRGERELRQEIAAYLAIARGIKCTPSQVFITIGYAGALGLALRALNLRSGCAWTEEPGYPLTRTALHLSGITPIPITVDSNGIDVAEGIAIAPAAELAVVTPGQQAPYGMTLSPSRRRALLDWAGRNKSWIIEDDYLSELQLNGRATPALASIDVLGRVVHIGTFSKTISPALRLGFTVVPNSVKSTFGAVATTLAPAPNVAVQRAVAAFIREGHYLRHLRRMKRLYTYRRQAIVAAVGNVGAIEAMAGLAVIVKLPNGAHDTKITKEAAKYGLKPSPLSPWFERAMAGQQGLLLGVTNVSEKTLAHSWSRLAELIRRYG